MNGMRSPACARDAADRRRAAARPAKRRWSAALASRHGVGCLLLNPDRRIRIRWLPRARGWTVNEIPSTPGRCECWPPPPAGELGASERAQQAPSTLPVVLAWHGGTEHRGLCLRAVSRGKCSSAVLGAPAACRAVVGDHGVYSE